jgi:hypothetical protein
MLVLERILQSEFNDALSVLDIGEAELLVVTADKVGRFTGQKLSVTPN